MIFLIENLAIVSRILIIRVLFNISFVNFNHTTKLRLYMYNYFHASYNLISVWPR